MSGPTCDNCQRPARDCAANHSQDCWRARCEWLQAQLDQRSTGEPIESTVVHIAPAAALAMLEQWFVGALHVYREAQEKPLGPRLPIKYQILGTNLGWLLTLARRAVEPLPIRICCERCGELHIDEGDFATKIHHTHSCQHCGLTWRPAVAATVGVQFLPGFKNEKKP